MLKYWFDKDENLEQTWVYFYSIFGQLAVMLYVFTVESKGNEGLKMRKVKKSGMTRGELDSSNDVNSQDQSESENDS